MRDYRSCSFWLDTCGDDLTPRAPLRVPRDWYSSVGLDTSTGLARAGGLGANAALWAMGSADRAEARTGKPSRRAELVGSDRPVAAAPG